MSGNNSTLGQATLVAKALASEVCPGFARDQREAEMLLWLMNGQDLARFVEEMDLHVATLPTLERLVFENYLNGRTLVQTIAQLNITESQARHYRLQAFRRLGELLQPLM